MTHVSLAELAAADVRLRPEEAVSIVRELCRQHAQGAFHGTPSPQVIRLTEDGRVLVEGPVSALPFSVRAAASLLDDLLPETVSPPRCKSAGALRLVLARATGALDLPEFGSLEAFAAALDRFATARLSHTVSNIYRVWQSSRGVAPGPMDLTISDVRRARRATGLSLDAVSAGSGVPAMRLRELEWGYLRNWPADDSARDSLRRYARASGLDEDLVLSVAWPLVEESRHAAEPAWALVPSGPQALVPSRSALPLRTAWRRAWLAAGATLLLVAGLLMPAPAKRPEVQTVARAAEAPPLKAITPAAVERVPAPKAAPKARPRPKGARPQSFLNRELFRIVIK